MRLLIVDHMAVESSRRAVYRMLAHKDGWDVHLVVPPEWSGAGRIVRCEDEEDSTLHLHVLPVVFGRRAHRVIYRHLAQLLRQLQPDFLYVNAEPENYAAIGALALRAMIVPRAGLSLVSWRNIDHRKIGYPYRLSFINRFCDRTIRRYPVDILFCRAKEGESLLAPYALKVLFRPDAVDCGLFTPDLKGSMRTERNLTIGFVGRITESKGVKVLLHAFAALGGHHQLVLVGRGDLEIELKQTAERLGVEDRTVILPPVLHSEMPEVMRSFDILVLPSLETLYWREQFGRVLIEGMACGIPVVASRSGSIPEVVGDTGVLFESGNTTSLKESLASLMASPSKREELGRKGRERVLQNYDVTIAAEALSRDLLSVLPNR